MAKWGGKVYRDEVEKRKQLRKQYLKEGQPLPPALRERILFRVKSEIGTLTVREQAGLIPSKAVKVVKEFEKSIEGRPPVLDALLAVLATGGKLTEAEQRLLDILQTKRGRKLQLARSIAESGANPVKVMDLYAKGLIHLRATEAKMNASDRLPEIIDNLNDHATSEDSELKKFAMEKILEINKVIEKGPLVQQTTNVQQNTLTLEGGTGLLERLRKATDDVLYKREEVVEAEVVKE